jgi:hypothetical protein
MSFADLELIGFGATASPARSVRAKVGEKPKKDPWWGDKPPPTDDDGNGNGNGNALESSEASEANGNGNADTPD